MAKTVKAYDIPVHLGKIDEELTGPVYWHDYKYFNNEAEFNAIYKQLTTAIEGYYPGREYIYVILSRGNRALYVGYKMS